jgi:DNA-binding PadR family transcriptional regulator
MPGAYRDIYSGLVRLHVLHHASIAPIYGLEMLRELRRHGYRLGPGTLYPLLHSMERRGFLRSRQGGTGGKTRRLYRATSAGRRALKEAREKVRELFLELTEIEG